MKQQKIRLALAVALLAAQPGWCADVISSYSYDSFYSESGKGTVFDTGSDITTTTAPLSHTSTVAPATLSLFVQTDFGVQKGAVTSARFGGGTEPFQGGGGQINSRWFDTFVINGGVGIGTAVYQVLIDGAISFSTLSSLPSAQINLNVLSNTFGVQYFKSVGRGTDEERWKGTSFVDGLLTSEFTFTYGSPFTVQSDLNLLAQDGGIARFESTILTGFALPLGATLSSESGATYATISAVPEPSTVVLTLGGFCLLARRFRSRKVLADA